MDKLLLAVDDTGMRIKLEVDQTSTKQPPAFMTVDELPDTGETLHAENSDIFEIVKITRTPLTKEQDAIVVVKDQVSGAAIETVPNS